MKIKIFQFACFSFKALMGIFYYVGAVALAEDIPEVKFENDLKKFYADMDQGFQQVSL